MSRLFLILKKTALSFIFALLVFGPITGLILDEYSYQLNWQRPLLLASLVALLRFLSAWPNHFFKQKTVSVRVANSSPYSRWAIGFFVIAALVFPFFSSNYWLSIAILALIYVLLGLGLNIVVGLAGLLDLGFVAFYAVGAYTYALGYQYWDLGFWTALPLSALFAGLFGAILAFPVLRMHGDYLAIVTLGFGEIIRLVLNNWASFTGGPNGATVHGLTLFGLEFSRRAKQGGTPFHQYFDIDYSRAYHYLSTYLVLLAVVLLISFIAVRLKRMPLGRAWEALREDEIACRSLGINHVNTKLSAFSIGAAIGGLGGVFFAAYQGFVNPSSFTFMESALILAIVVLGGLGSIPGVIIAAIVLTVLPEALRDFSSYRVLIFGLLMVLMMIWRPQGLLPIKRPIFQQKGNP